MAHRQFPHALDAPALKWRDLAERRRAHFIELYDSGRWQHYYTYEQFVAGMRQAVSAANRWAEIAPKPGDARRPVG